MSTLLCATALAALAVDLKPLSEERKLEGVEQVALEYALLEAPKIGEIGWIKTTVQRGQLDGAIHYVVVRQSEVLDFEAFGVRSSEMRGVYNDKLELVHEVGLDALPGTKGTSVEFEWEAEGFRWREGKAKWTAVGAEIRPTAETDIALFVHGLELAAPYEARVFDKKAGAIETRTVQPGVEKKVDGDLLTVFEEVGGEPTSHFLRSDGAFLRSKRGKMTVVGIDRVENVDQRVRRSIADNEAFEAALAQAVAASWTEKKGTFTNELLGMSLKLPKGWTRSPESEANGSQFQAFSADQNAFVSVVVSSLGTGYDLDGWSEVLEADYKELAKDGKVKAKSRKVGKTDAFSVEYTSAGEPALDSAVWAWKRNGVGVMLNSATWDKAPKKLHKETASILKSVKLAR